jgi:hypothetical protein
MPLLRIELTHETQPDIVRDTIEKARAIIHSVKGDPESMISVFVQSNVQGVFGHSGKPAANVHLSSFNMTPAVTAALTRQLSDLLQSRFGIAPDSAYIFFWNVEQPHLTGWSGRTFAEIMLQQRGIREEFARRVRGRLLNTRSHPKTGQPVPLAGLRIELWNPRPNDTDGGAKVARFLNEGVVGPDGFFEVFFPATPAAQDAPPTVLQLRVFEPDQLAIVEGQPVTRRFLAAMQPIPDDGVSPDLPIGIIRLPFYEYDSEWPFPYAVPDSIRQGFSDRQEARFQESEQFATLIGLRIFSELDSTPGGLSIAQVQAKFPDSLTLQMERQTPGSSRADDFFAERVLNNMAPPLLRIDPKDNSPYPSGDPNVYVLDYNWRLFERRPDLTLLSFRARFTNDGKRLQPLDISLGLDNEDDTTKYTRLTPRDGARWEQAKRVVRANYNNLVGQVQVHLAQVHFNMEQYGIAFLRSVFRNPVRKLLYPFVKEILAINEKGRTTLLGGPSIVYVIEPISRECVGRWVVDTIGRQDWKGWSPRRPLCEGHGYARAAGLYWTILSELVDNFFAENSGGITQHWSEIVAFSDTLGEHAVPHVERPLETPPDAGIYYCMNEVAQSRPKGSPAITPIARVVADDAAIEDLKQICRYVIFHSTFLHSWTHLHMITDLGELKYSGMVRNGGMGPEDDDKYIAPVREATFALGSTHTLGQMNCGYMLRNEDGDIPAELIAKLKTRGAEFQTFGFDVERLCARLNT